MNDSIFKGAEGNGVGRCIELRGQINTWERRREVKDEGQWRAFKINEVRAEMNGGRQIHNVEGGSIPLPPRVGTDGSVT